MIIGDFNCVLEQVDKKGGKVVSSSSSGGFRGMVDSNGLIDMGFSGYAFTWNNKRVGQCNIQDRLDRCFANGDWRYMYPTACVSHFTALHSDHRPILINTSPPSSSHPRPFRFEEMWTRDEFVTRIISNAWSRG